MTASRPYTDAGAVLEAADATFDDLGEEDWLEAFAGHPRIGERGDAVADLEQSGTAEATGATLMALAETNQAYEDKFGFTYIVYASGKSAEEMLEIARQRISGTREQEVVAAAGQQRRITETRLRRMLCLGATS
jgi:OHCU decarboxylase